MELIAENASAQPKADAPLKPNATGNNAGPQCKDRYFVHGTQLFLRATI
jgi:hypothetical protein